MDVGGTSRVATSRDLVCLVKAMAKFLPVREVTVEVSQHLHLGGASRTAATSGTVLEDTKARFQLRDFGQVRTPFWPL